jgi:glutaredoxin|tara:strand:+ start:127 stop:369 length:243 start_codon:yes stop_codon:yes gene_type:complete
MRAIIWSKNNCILCTKAKNLLERKGINYEERNVEGPDWTPEQFFEAVPNARTFPQIYLDGKYIGGYDMMISHWQLGELRL